MNKSKEQLEATERLLHELDQANRFQATQIKDLRVALRGLIQRCGDNQAISEVWLEINSPIIDRLVGQTGYLESNK